MSTAFLVYGATGKQGGALVKSLIKQPGFSPTTHTIYGVTRDIYSASAKKLASLSPAIKPIQGDFDNAPAIFAQLDPKPLGVYIVHAVSGNETKACNAIIDEAIKQGAQHIVFSSVDRGGSDSDHSPTDIPHFVTKHDVELHLKSRTECSNDKLTYTILRPVFFLDNLLPGFFGRVTVTAWRDTLGSTPLQVVDTKDIGEFAALALMNPKDDFYKNKAISLAGDKLTFEAADKIWQAKLGEHIPTTYGLLTKAIQSSVKEFSTMFRWFKTTGYKADIQELNAVKPMTNFEQWVEREMVSKK